MTRLNLIQPCVSLALRLCHPSWPLATFNATRKVAQSLTPSRRQVWSGRYGGWLSGVHFHTCTKWAALSTSDPEDRRDDPSSGTHDLRDGPEDLRDWQEDDQHDTEMVEYAMISETALSDLQNYFGMTEEDAQYVLLCQSNKATGESILHKLRLLHKCGITGAQIYRIPWILDHNSDDLAKKLEKIREPYLFQEYSEGLGFCYLPIKQIEKYQRSFKREANNFPHHTNRIYYLAERLQVPVELFTDKIGKPHKFLNMNIKRTISMIDLFHQYGLSSEDIVADLWVFGYCDKKAEKRLQEVIRLGCTDLKPWMCRCSNKIFDRFCERYRCGKELMGMHESLISYLSERLHCDPRVMEKAFKSNMVMKKVHISKFSKIIDLLLEEGISGQEISSCMRVFQYSEERTMARIKELKRLNFFPFPLGLLCRTPGQFNKLMSERKKLLTMKNLE